MSEPVPPPPPPASAAAPAPAPGPATRAASCVGSKAVKYCYPAHKGPPRQVPNASFVFDKQGCVGDGDVVDTCEGVTAVLSGPTLEGKNCCHRVCRGMIPPCGRPLLAVDGSARVAPATPRRDWLGEAVSVRPVPAALGGRLRRAWLDDAAAEHASVAAFARFSLELLAVGAPASLVTEAQRAGLDEIEHARACFAIAAAYGEGDVGLGPSALSLSGVTLRSDLAEIAAAVVSEACVGETFAALALAEAGERCEDASIREVLTRIADDEARHAELGFRFVAWALGRGGAPVRAAVEDAFRSALAVERSASRPHEGDDDAWRAAGRLTGDDEIAVWARASREVIGPCRDALLARGVADGVLSTRETTSAPSRDLASPRAIADEQGLGGGRARGA